MKNTVYILAVLLGMNVSCAQEGANTKQVNNISMKTDSVPFQRSEEEWRKILSPEQYEVLRMKGTERPFTGKYNLHKEEGVYKCAACGEVLFTSNMKFESSCGWPSFDEEIAGGKILKREDRSHGMIRTEILCANCGSHLGHLFDDGPTESGLRYCVNSVSLDFEKK